MKKLNEEELNDVSGGKLNILGGELYKKCKKCGKPVKKPIYYEGNYYCSACYCEIVKDLKKPKSI